MFDSQYSQNYRNSFESMEPLNQLVAYTDYTSGKLVMEVQQTNNERTFRTCEAMHCSIAPGEPEILQ